MITQQLCRAPVRLEHQHNSWVCVKTRTRCKKESHYLTINALGLMDLPQFSGYPVICCAFVRVRGDRAAPAAASLFRAADAPRTQSSAERSKEEEEEEV